MKRSVEDWPVEKLHKERRHISFPEYQRQDNLWSDEKKGLLIDSILRNIDIPKLYFNKTREGNFEVVDGQQRLWAIWGFLDGVYPLKIDGTPHKFAELGRAKKDWIKKYKLQISVLQEADNEYLQELFIRLQLGLLLITGEKLNAASGEMREFAFRKLPSHKFVRTLGIPSRRFAKETLCAQICINFFTRAKLNAFSRTRYEDLQYFFREYEHPKGKDLGFFRDSAKQITGVLDQLSECFGNRTKDLKNRSYILSVYLFFEELIRRDGMLSGKDQRIFVDFVFKLWKRLREEASAGFGRKNRELYSFETFLSSASGEKYQIERRHQKLLEFYNFFKQNRKIKGDPS